MWSSMAVILIRMCHFIQTFTIVNWWWLVISVRDQDKPGKSVSYIIVGVLVAMQPVFFIPWCLQTGVRDGEMKEDISVQSYGKRPRQRQRGRENVHARAIKQSSHTTTVFKVGPWPSLSENLGISLKKAGLSCQIEWLCFPFKGQKGGVTYHSYLSQLTKARRVKVSLFSFDFGLTWRAIV